MCPLINDYMIEGIEASTGNIRKFAVIPKECGAWSAHTGHKRTIPGQCQPGQVCAKNCKLIPCIAIRMNRTEEIVAREAYVSEVASTDSMR